jgi:uncharacterized protein YkwD
MQRAVSASGGGCRMVPVAFALSVVLLGVAPRVGRADDLAPIGTCPGADATVSSPADQMSGMLCLINYARGQHALNALSTSDVLIRSAGFKANDEVACNDFSHTPCGKPVEEPFQRAGYIDASYEWKVGENLAKQAPPLSAPRDVMQAWLNSTEHRDNILSPDWTEQGVALLQPGSYLGLAGSAVWVSHFGERHLLSPADQGGGGGDQTASAGTNGAPKRRPSTRASCRTSRSGARASGVGLPSRKRPCRKPKRRRHHHR